MRPLIPQQTQEFSNLLSELEEKDIKTLREMIHVELDRRAKIVAISFRQGEKVWFKEKHGSIIHGTVTKIGIKNIVVKPDAGILTWRVHSSFLNRE